MDRILHFGTVVNIEDGHGGDITSIVTDDDYLYSSSGIHDNAAVIVRDKMTYDLVAILPQPKYASMLSVDEDYLYMFSDGKVHGWSKRDWKHAWTLDGAKQQASAVDASSNSDSILSLPDLDSDSPQTAYVIDDDYIYVGHKNCVVRIYDKATRKFITERKIDDSPYDFGAIQRFHLHRDFLLAVSSNGKVNVFRKSEWKFTKQIALEHGMYDFIVSIADDRMYVTNRSDSVYIYSIDDWSLVDKIEATDGRWWNYRVVAADSTNIYLGRSNNLEIRDWWDYEEKEIVEMGQITLSDSTVIEYLHIDNDTIYCGMNNGSIYVVDADTYGISNILKGHKKIVQSCAFSENFEYNIHCGCKDGILRHWSKDDEAFQWRLKETSVCEEDIVKGISEIIADGTYFFAACDHSVQIWWMGGLEKKIDMFFPGPMALDARFFYVSDSESVYVYERENWKETEKLDFEDDYSNLKSLCVHLLDDEDWEESERLLFCGQKSLSVIVLKGTPGWRGFKWKVMKELEYTPDSIFPDDNLLTLEIDQEYLYAKMDSGKIKRWNLDGLDCVEDAERLPSKSAGSIEVVSADGSIVLIKHTESSGSDISSLRGSLDDEYLVIFGDDASFPSIVRASQIAEHEEAVFELVFQELEELAQSDDVFDYVAKSESKADELLEKGKYTEGLDIYSVLVKSVGSSPKVKSLLEASEHNSLVSRLQSKKSLYLFFEESSDMMDYLEQMENTFSENSELKIAEIEEKLTHLSAQIDDSIAELNKKLEKLGPYRKNGERRLRVAKRKAKNALQEFKSRLDARRNKVKEQSHDLSTSAHVREEILKDILDLVQVLEEDLANLEDDSEEYWEIERELQENLLEGKKLAESLGKKDVVESLSSKITLHREKGE